MAYQNLKAELKRFSVSYGQVAEVLCMSTNNLSMKVNERIPMTVEEAKKIRDEFCPDADLDYLLTSDGDSASKREQVGNVADIAAGDAVEAIRSAWISPDKKDEK